MKKTTQELCAMIGKLGDDEREIIEWIVEGLTQGRITYGQLDAARDPRNWRREALEEVRDALIYAGAALVRDTATVLAEKRAEPASETTRDETCGLCAKRLTMSVRGSDVRCAACVPW